MSLRQQRDSKCCLIFNFFYQTDTQRYTGSMSFEDNTSGKFLCVDIKVGDHQNVDKIGDIIQRANMVSIFCSNRAIGSIGPVLKDIPE